MFAKIGHVMYGMRRVKVRQNLIITFLASSFENWYSDEVCHKKKTTYICFILEQETSNTIYEDLSQYM